MRRFALAAIVASLSFSASGVLALVLAEPCTGYQQPGREDNACPPTCAICGCCAQAAEPAMVLVARPLETRIADIAALIPGLPHRAARDIFHVPKPLLA
ncbi:MAG TPA: hypothetical protein VF424_00430 [Vicinamibacterales bacterium]